MEPQKEETQNNNGKLQVCPDEWIDNQMPQSIPDPQEISETQKINNQYYILEGQRREIDEFDAEWVKLHCKIESQKVY